MMAPRFTILIIVGIVVYVSLSVYHWRQVKKIPGAEKQNAVHAVLSRDSREKNWVQVSTAPGQSGENAKKLPLSSSETETVESAEQPELPATDPLPENAVTIEEKTVSPPSQDVDTFRSENNELRKTLQHERSINHRQAQEINDLTAQIIALQSTLDATSAATREKDNAQQKPQQQSPGISSDLEGFNAEKSQINTLKTLLAAKSDALAKANERITGLAARLDQGRQTLAEAEDTNASLQNVLSSTENDAIKAQHDADRFHAQLLQAREDREKYLAETGRLHVQLQQAKSRLAQLESELSKTRLTSEAMLRYGKEQTELITPFKQQIEIINARVEDKNSELLRAEDEISQLREREQMLHENIGSLQAELQKSEVNNETLQVKSQNLESVQKHADELTAQLQVLADQLNERDAKISALTENLGEAQTTAQTAAQRSEILQKEREQLQQELTIYQQQLDASTLRQQNLETELDAMRETIVQHNSKIEEQAKLLEIAGEEAFQLTSRLKESEERLAEKENALQNLQKALDELQTTQPKSPPPDNTETENMIRQLQNALDAARSHLAETETELLALKQSQVIAETGQTDDSATTELQQEIDQLRQSIAEMEMQQKDAVQTASELKDENRMLHGKITAAEKANREKAEFESKLAQQTKDLDREKERFTILENETADLRSELDRRETAFFTLQEEYTSLQDRFDSLQRERDTFFPYTLDSDNDSVSDAQDRCPGTIQGAEVGRDGCEYDSDRDGVVDRLDLCPETAGEGDTNTFGCTRGEDIVLSGIFFSGGNADLSAASQAYLDQVAAILELDSDARFEVAGHTDSIGEPDRNLTVSRQRAGAVTDYLVNKGIQAGRLVPVGYGSEQPVADNATPEGRAANRRVELRIIQPVENPASSTEAEPVTTAEEEDLPVR